MIQGSSGLFLVCHGNCGHTCPLAFLPHRTGLSVEPDMSAFLFFWCDGEGFSVLCLFSHFVSTLYFSVRCVSAPTKFHWSDWCNGTRVPIGDQETLAFDILTRFVIVFVVNVRPPPQHTHSLIDSETKVSNYHPRTPLKKKKKVVKCQWSARILSESRKT